MQCSVCPEDITNAVNYLYLKEGLSDEDLVSFAHQISIGMVRDLYILCIAGLGNIVGTIQ